jgi:hypothetical protein
LWVLAQLAKPHPPHRDSPCRSLPSITLTERAMLLDSRSAGLELYSLCTLFLVSVHITNVYFTFLSPRRYPCTTHSPLCLRQSLHWHSWAFAHQSPPPGVFNPESKLPVQEKDLALPRVGREDGHVRGIGERDDVVETQKVFNPRA